VDVEKLESEGVVLFSVRCCKQAIPKPVNRFSASVQYWLANIWIVLDGARVFEKDTFGCSTLKLFQGDDKSNNFGTSDL